MVTRIPQSGPHDNATARDPQLACHLLGTIALDACLELQKRLAEDLQRADRSRLLLLIAEHPLEITIGRSGSRGHIRWTNQELRARGLHVRWLSRGGGCVLHAPGQLAVYPLVPLAVMGWSIPDFLKRFQQGLRDALESLGIPTRVLERGHTLVGRTGPLVVFGLSVRRGVTRHGAFLNVNPAMKDYAFVESTTGSSVVGAERRTLSCLVAEHPRAARMPLVRAALAEHVARRLGCERYHLFTGHPWLRTT